MSESKTTAITAEEKKEICRRFVADVLKARVKKLDAEQFKLAKKLTDVALPKKIVDLVNTVMKMSEDRKNDALMEMMGVSCDTWLRDRQEIKSEITYEVDIYLGMGIDDYISLDEERIIKLKYPCRIDTDDWNFRIMPDRESKEPNAVKWWELNKAGEKLQADARKLYDAALKSITRKRTFEAIEKNCPELAPYIDAPDDSSPCPAHLADMASCMRIKDDC